MPGKGTTLYLAPVTDPGSDSRAASFLRRGLLGILLFAFLGTLVELYLLEHYDGWRQWVPLALLALGVVLAGVLLIAPRPLVLGVWRGLMAAFLAAGAVGTWFHYAGNVEFELERTPELGGVALIGAALEGATPALAPGTMLQFGLLGLLLAYRYPPRPR